MPLQLHRMQRRNRARTSETPPERQPRQRRWRLSGLGGRVGRAWTALEARSPLLWYVALGLVALVLFVVTWSTVTRTHQVDLLSAPMVAAVTVLPLALARQGAFVGWALTMFLGVVFWVTVEPSGTWELPWTVPQVIVLFLLTVAVGLQEPLRLVVVAWAGSVLTLLIVMPGDNRPGLALGITAATVVALLVRWLLLSRRQLARQQELGELERAQRAVLEERSRIARDLHDVVAHRMSMVVVQAQSAAVRLGGIPAPVADEFMSISEQARAALNEVRGMLGVLRSESTPAPGSPQRGVADVEELLQQTRDAGVDLVWDVHGDPEPVGAAVGMVVYRILQEALANASRHAPGSAVRVQVTYSDEVHVEVGNGRAAAEAPPPDAGHAGAGTGVIGMSDRARSVGGALAAGPDGDGFLVRATLPLTARILVE